MEGPTVVCADEKEMIIIVAIVLIQALPNDTRSENNSLASRGSTRHLIDKIQIMLTRDIRDINGPSTHTSGSSMKSRVFVNGLEHVPIRNQVQVLSEEGIVCIDEDMPWVTGWNLREEIIRVSDQDRRAIDGHLRMKEDLWGLGHARNSLHAEVSKCRNSPGIEVRGNEIATSFGGDECVEHELST